jgi:hypothetical protein
MNFCINVKNSEHTLSYVYVVIPDHHKSGESRLGKSLLKSSASWGWLDVLPFISTKQLPASPSIVTDARFR